MMPVSRETINNSSPDLLRLRSATLVVAVASLLFSTIASPNSLDEGVSADGFLSSLVASLGESNIDVSSNLNARDVVRQRLQQPRLGRFPDLPIGTLALSEEILSWESAYVDSEVGGLAILIDGSGQFSSEVFTEHWLESSDERRLFVTFHESDSGAAEKLAEVASANGHRSALYFGAENVSDAGQLYATAAQRLAIDSRSARRYRTDVTELDFLGERVRRKSNSLFVEDGNRGKGSLARREPSVFLKETLGDEFNQSTIEAIIVPGGVALGESASIDIMPSELVFEQRELFLLDTNGMRWRLPAIELSDVKALYDFVTRSEAIGSDAIVDIDADGRVKISSALRDTDVGYAIMHADTQPFEFVPNLPVTKSVIIDTGVAWQRAAESENLQFDADYEVRFLSADNMRIAQTRVALEYNYASQRKSSLYSDSWGRDVGRLHEDLDYSGLGKSMEGIATYAAWVALFRYLQEEDVRFLRGRYFFMKIDKSGEKTPIRY